jgi:biopolymer transport protein ExbD
MRFRRGLRIEANVSLVPMIDIVFQLVVFFMVSTTFIVTPGISLVLPSSTTAEPVVMGRLVVTVAGPDEIYLNQRRHTIQSLDESLGALSEEERKEIKTVVLEGDRDVPYSLTVAVLDVLRRNGFQGVNLRTREP